MQGLRFPSLIAPLHVTIEPGNTALDTSAGAVTRTRRVNEMRYMPICLYAIPGIVARENLIFAKEIQFAGQERIAIAITPSARPKVCSVVMFSLKTINPIARKPIMFKIVQIVAVITNPFCKSVGM